MDYDVLVLGGGIIGCAVAYELSKYNLNIALIEKDFDIADDISFVNTSIVYDGSEAEDDLMAALEILGNSMLDDITKKFNVPFKRLGSLTIAEDDESIKHIQGKYDKAKKRGIKEVYIIDDKAVKDIEPGIQGKVKKALYARNTGVIAPYDLAIAYAEVAFDNGVSFKLEEVVLDIQKMAKGLKVTTNKNKFSCRVVINTIPGDNYSIDNNKCIEREKGEDVTYISLENKFKGKLSNIVFTPRKKDSFMMHIPSLNGGMLIGISDTKPLGFHNTVKNASSILTEVTKNDVNSFFQSKLYFEKMFINDSDIQKGYVKITGDNYAEITVTPSIAKMVCESIVNYLNCVPNKNFIDKRREFYRFKDLTKEERNEIIVLDRRYGNIVCLCNQVTEGEIVDSIRRPLGARTVEGVKRRTGASFGSCHGAYCINKIIKILAREMDKKPTELVEDSKNSNVLLGRIKEFDDI